MRSFCKKEKNSKKKPNLEAQELKFMIMNQSSSEIRHQEKQNCYRVLICHDL